MAAFLKIVSGVYLALIWFVFAFAVSHPNDTGPYNHDAVVVVAFVIAIGLSIPAAVLFAFGQVVGDVRIMRSHVRQQNEHLRAIRAYYEPSVKS